jgi:hypothetical protein
MILMLLILGFYSILLLKSILLFCLCTTRMWAEFPTFQRHILLPFSGLKWTGLVSVCVWVLGSTDMQRDKGKGKDSVTVVLCQLKMVVIMNSELGRKG